MDTSHLCCSGYHTVKAAAPQATHTPCASTSQEGTPSIQDGEWSMVELSEKQNFPSTSPSQWGLPLRWQEGTGKPGTAGTAPAGLSGKRISAGLSNNGPQLPGSLGYWKHMSAGEKGKKAAENPHNCCWPAGERNQSVAGEAPLGDTAAGLHIPACTARHPTLPASRSL